MSTKGKPRGNIKGQAFGQTVQTCKVWINKAKSKDVPLDQLYREINRGFDYFWNSRGGNPFPTRWQ